MSSGRVAGTALQAWQPYLVVQQQTRPQEKTNRHLNGPSLPVNGPMYKLCCNHSLPCLMRSGRQQWVANGYKDSRDKGWVGAEPLDASVLGAAAIGCEGLPYSAW